MTARAWARSPVRYARWPTRNGCLTNGQLKNAAPTSALSQPNDRSQRNRYRGHP